MNRPIKRDELLFWLYHSDSAELENLWNRADNVRRQNVGDDVFFRGLIEISNYCQRRCAYCGINAANSRISRYRMSTAEILDCARQAVRFGYGTIVLQAGEDPGLTRPMITDLIIQIKNETGLAVTLSLGERAIDELWEWRQAGADRYLLRFETSNVELYNSVHPAKNSVTTGLERIAILGQLRQMDYEVGSGVLIGMPGQSYNNLADDLELFHELDLDMIGVGPFIPHPHTPLGSPGGRAKSIHLDPEIQAPNTELMAYKMMALSRLNCPKANIPSTTALATLNLSSGRELGLQRGANIIMPNLTPPEYRKLYEIYPAKACLLETAEQFQLSIKARIEGIGRKIGVGPGGSPAIRARDKAADFNTQKI